MMEKNGGNLYLRNTSITSLPEGLTVGGWLDLRNTPITSLPEGLTVGGNLYLSYTSITSLPEGLIVGGNLFYDTFKIKNVEYTRLTDGDMVEGKYIFCDGKITHITHSHKFGKYTYYVGKIKGKNVVTDGTHYAHCKTFKDGVADLEFKAAKARGQEQYNHLTADSTVTKDEAIQMYRIITGACRAGTEAFLSTIKEFKDTYTVAEIIALTDGQYGADAFREFFERG